MELKFSVTGMSCAACSARVEKVTREIDGVQKADVNLLSGKMMVEADRVNVTDAIISAVRAAGYDACIEGGEKKPAADHSDQLKGMHTRLVSFFILIFLMYFTMGHMLGLPLPGWYCGAENAIVAALLQFLLTLPIVLINSGYYKKGLKALLHRSPNMDSLIAVGSGASLVYGLFALFRMGYAIGHGDMQTVIRYSENLYFESAAMILTLITLGKYLEARAKGKTSDAIRHLMDLSPKTATILDEDGTERIVSADAVKPGDIVVVRSGGRIPVDGFVVSGNASIDQSSLTGESVPVDVSEGDYVSASTINTQGYIRIRTEKVGSDTTLAAIIRMVDEAGGSKAPISRLADKVAGIFVPTVMVISAITFFAWLIAGQTFEFALNVAISVLVISCPCALGLATPVAIMVGTGRGAGMGILFKNALSLENLHKIDTVVLDKTGTITTGKPEVTDVIAQGCDRNELLDVAFCLESASEHPYAKAIVRYCAGRPSTKPDSFQTLPGMGVSGIINEKRYFGGNRRLMDSLGISVPDSEVMAEAGKTPLYFACEDGRYLGLIAAADALKEDTASAVQALKKLGLSVVLLTGDNENTAKSIAEKAGIDSVVAEVLPGDKAGVISKLQQAHKKVLMVGDGINDAPALVTADVGMAVGAGTDIAMESADIVLMNSSISAIPSAIELSRATLRNIRQNLFWAFFYNCIGIPIAAGVLYPAFGILLSPMIGAAAMSMSSVFVVSNALRLRMFRSKSQSLAQENIIHNLEENDMETVIKVEGMMCVHCKARVESVCKAVAGVTDAIVDLEAKQVTVSGNATVEALKKAITDAGYEVIG